MIGALVTFAFPASAQQATEPAPVSAPDDHAESWTVPVVHGLGLMTSMRIGEAVLWPEPFADTRPSFWWENYKAAITRPPKWDSTQAVFEWDGDAWYLNAVGHALFGSELYLRARTCRKNVLGALLFTAAGSTLWEYGFEANGVRPSALDLVYTPAAGLVLGETRFQLWRAAKRIDDSGWRGVFTSLLDPLGELERVIGTPC